MSPKQFLSAVLALVMVSLCGCGGGGGSGSSGSTAGPPAPPSAFSSGKWSAPETFSSSGVVANSNSIVVDSLGTTTYVLSEGSNFPFHITGKAYRKALHAPWGPGEDLTPAVPVPNARTRDFLGLQVRVDSSENVFAVWNFLDIVPRDGFLSDRDYVSTVSVRRRDAATGQWSAPQLLQNDPAAFASDVRLAVEGGGSAWAVWTERTFEHEFFAAFDRYRIFARKFTPASGWGTAEAVSPEFPFAPTVRVSTDRRGNPRVLIAFNSGVPLESTLYFTSRDGMGTWAALTPLAHALPVGGLAPNFNEYDLAVDSDDSAIAMWRQYDGTRHLILARRFTVGTGWGPTTLLMIPNFIEDGISPQLAMDPQGNAFIVWQQFDGNAFGIWAARFSKASGWERLDIINSPNPGDSLEPKIGFDAAGNAVAVWRRFDFGLNATIVRANYYDARTGWGTDETISIGNGVAETLELAVSPTGFATAIWWNVENNMVTPRSSTRVP